MKMKYETQTTLNELTMGGGEASILLELEPAYLFIINRSSFAVTYLFDNVNFFGKYMIFDKYF
jgi:hypothetical protein